MATKAIGTAPISYKDAGLYLQNIKDIDLKMEYKNYLGGTFNVKEFKNQAQKKEFSGLMFWFCLDSNGKLYLGWEPKFNFEYPNNKPDESASLEPIQNNLIIPSQLFGRDLNDNVDHEIFVRTHNCNPPLLDDHLKKEDAILYKRNFLNHKIYKTHQKYAHAYFEDKEEKFVQNFLNITGIEHVRYYFGYDNTEKPNYIRVFLAPVDAIGANIQIKDFRSKGELLQKSVPPPPNT